MATERLPLGVIVERRPARSPWLDHVWRAVAVLPGSPETPPWSVLGEENGIVRYFAGTAELELFPAETTFYKHNLESPEPAVYVVLRRGAGPVGLRLQLATVNPSEAQAHAEAGDDILEAVPMPPAVFEHLAAFVARHHVERPEWRRRRDRADAEALARRPRILMEDDDD